MDYQLIKWVLFLPIIGFLIQAFLGKRIQESAGKKVVGGIAVTFIFVAFIIGALITKSLSDMDPAARMNLAPVHIFNWINTFGLSIPFELRVDPLSMTMVLVITGVGSLIHLYATGYMNEEREFSRFFSYLNLFVAFMLVLVLGNNLALLFIGWEGVGLCSYLLIGFWYKDWANARAANKAFIVNRIGDWGLTLGMFLIFAMIVGNMKTLGLEDTRYFSYDVLMNAKVLKIFEANPTLTTVAALLLFVGAMGKSAQFPLYFWLPDAMAGPTPVSALIHAATMVTAGVVLLNRMHFLYELSPVASAVVACVGAFTALFAAIIAFGQTDIKKVLAYSTVSQLGFMFVACGVGAYWVGMFHVVTHAFFKALLFLGSGAVIYAMSHDQDMRHYGKLAKYIKITCFTMIIGWFAISGVPPFAGFWSKEAIIGSAMGNHLIEFTTNLGPYVGGLCLFVAFLTATYMTRMMMLTFFGPTEQWRTLSESHAVHEHVSHEHEHAHSDHGEDEHGFFFTDAEMLHEEHEHHHELDAHHEPKEVPFSMWFPLVVLAILSAAGGWLMAKGEVFQNWLYPKGLTFLEHGVVPGEPETGFFADHSKLMVYGIGAGVAGILVGILMYYRGLPKSEGFDMSKWAWWRKSALNQFGYDKTVVDAGVEGGAALADFSWKVVDAKGVDGLVNGAAKLTGGLGTLVRYAQTGLVRGYAAWMMAGVVAIAGYLVWTVIQVGGGK